VPLLCPYCQHSMVVKDAKPGKYRPKCAKCGERFLLTVFSDASRQPLVEKLPAEGERASIATTPTVLYTHPEETATSRSPTPLPHQHEEPASQSEPAAAAKTVAVPQGEATVSMPTPPARRSEKTVGGGTGTTAVFEGASNVAVTLPINSASAPVPDRGMDATTAGHYEGETRVVTPEEIHRASGEIPATIGGYKIVKELGRGAMGAVYLARQMSLDREVALKTIQARYADNPTFIARFTREAYAAAQLTHHNVVQIYDLGQEGGTNYFSMEFVRGRSLDEVVRQEGKLDSEVAIGYILQAARGLQFAHEHGMVHRDVKPANMMVSDTGIVKVADLGLVKTPADAAAEIAAEAGDNLSLQGKSGSLAASTAGVTLHNIAMGTPAYMAPEQATNAAGVDHRADIYSLGCSLYVLLTGRPPFEGATAMEVITKHKTEPVVRPEAIVKRVPQRLSEICLKMVAKRPDDRYATLNEVIKDLEGFLGIQASGTWSPKEEHAQVMESSVKSFNSAAMTGLRGILPPAFFGLCLLVFLVAMLFGFWGFAGGVLGLACMTTAASFVISGLRQRAYLFEKFRGFVLSARITDWLTWIGGGLVFLLALWLLGMIWFWLGFAILAIGLAAGYSFVVVDGLARQRKEPLENMERLLKSLRLKGVDENSLRSFVARYSGDNWEEFFEALFGYEAKLAAREQFGRGDSGRTRKRFRGWRDGLCRWMDARLRADKERKERQHLQRIEEKSLQAQGIDVVAARKQSQAMADALMDEAEQVRKEPLRSATVIDPKAAAEAKRQRIKQSLSDARRGAYQPKKNRMLGLAASPLAFAFGGKMRFLLGCLLIAAFAMWVKLNADVFKFGQMQAAATNLAESVKTGDVKNAAETVKGSVADTAKEAAGAKDLPIPMLGPYLSGWPAGIAGVMLVILGLFHGWKMSLFALPAAAVILFGAAFGIPGGALVAAPIGLAIACVGFFFGRTMDP
jgi:eukaryotic-like serine/threonine-protein kinase